MVPSFFVPISLPFVHFVELFSDEDAPQSRLSLSARGSETRMAAAPMAHPAR